MNICPKCKQPAEFLQEKRVDGMLFVRCEVCSEFSDLAEFNRTWMLA